MSGNTVSEYNRDQWASFNSIRGVCERLPASEITRLKEMMDPYLAFRKASDDYQNRYFGPVCRAVCFKTGLSACCGFESIITFFADQVVNYLHSSTKQMATLFQVLQQPNDTPNCVYLGPKGCIWSIRPVSCAMFFCEEARDKTFTKDPEAQPLWQSLQRQEKDFTWPTRDILFDQLEKYFIRLGVESSHLYFHRSPGLLKLKAESGL